MLRLFRNQQTISLLLLLIILLVTRLPYFVLNDLQGADAYYLNIRLEQTALSIILASFVAFVQALWINQLFTNGQMMDEKTVVPALVWILLTAIHPGFVEIGFPLLSSTLILCMLHILLSVKGNVISKQECFHLGILSGILFLLHPPCIVMIPLFFGMIYNQNTLGFREYLMYLLGIFMVFFWSWSYAYINDLSLEWIHRLMGHVGLPIHVMHEKELVIWLMILLFCIGGFIGLFPLMLSASTKRKKNVRTVLLFCFGVILAFAISSHWDMSNILMVLLPLSFLITIGLLIITKNKIAELVFGIFVLTILSAVVLRILGIQ